MATSYEISDPSVHNARTTLMDQCASSPPAVPAILDAAINLVDNQHITVYRTIKDMLIEIFGEDDFDKTKSFVRQFLEMEFQRQKKITEVMNERKAKVAAIVKQASLSSMCDEQLMDFTTERLLRKCRESTTGDITVLKRAIDLVNDSDCKVSYRRLKETLLNEFDRHRFEKTKDFVEMLLKSAFQADQKKSSIRSLQREREQRLSLKMGEEKDDNDDDGDGGDDDLLELSSPVTAYTPTSTLSHTRSVSELSVVTLPSPDAAAPQQSYSLEQFDRDIEDLGYPVPTQESMREVLARGDNVARFQRHLRTARMVFHAKVVSLMKSFIKFKRSDHASTVERGLYKDMTPDKLATRLLFNRPLMFISESDRYLTRGGHDGSGGFDEIGTSKQRSPLKLKGFLSYDEMQLSALMSVCSQTSFLNNGRRSNMGRVEEPETYTTEGWYMGMVGARFERPDVMESQHMLVTKKQNTIRNGYGPLGTGPRRKLLKLWAAFYGVPHFWTFGDVERAVKTTHETRFLSLDDGECYLDRFVFAERLRVVILPFLRHCNRVCRDNNTKAYVHVVGLGLGVWMVNKQQAFDMINVYEQLLREVPLPHIADVDFSWFPIGCEGCSDLSDDKVFTTDSGHEIKIHFSRRNPSDLLEDADEDKTLFAQFAWDGNAFIGNEYWHGSLSASGDPAAAACSTIALTLNPDFNPAFLGGDQALFYAEDNDDPAVFEDIGTLGHAVLFSPTRCADVMSPSSRVRISTEDVNSPALVRDMIDNTRERMSKQSNEAVKGDLQQTIQLYHKFERKSIDKFIQQTSRILKQLHGAYQPIVNWVQGLLTLSHLLDGSEGRQTTEYLRELLSKHQHMHNGERVRSMLHDLACKGQGLRKAIRDKVSRIEVSRKRLRPLLSQMKQAQMQFNRASATVKKLCQRAKKRCEQVPTHAVERLTKLCQLWGKRINECSHCQWQTNQLVDELDKVGEGYSFDRLVKLMQFEWQQVQQQHSTVTDYRSPHSPVVQVENFEFMVVDTAGAETKLKQCERTQEAIHKFSAFMHKTVPLLPKYFELLTAMCVQLKPQPRWTNESQQSIITDLEKHHRNYHSESDQANFKAKLKDLQALVNDYDEKIVGMKQQLGQLHVLHSKRNDAQKDAKNMREKMVEAANRKLLRCFREGKELVQQLVEGQVTFFNEWNLSVSQKMKNARNLLASIGPELLSSLPHAGSIIALPHMDIPKPRP